MVVVIKPGAAASMAGSAEHGVVKCSVVHPAAALSLERCMLERMFDPVDKDRHALIIVISEI